MTAADTAVRVLRWATDPDGPPPDGSPADSDLLTDPPADVRAAAAGLAAVTAARLRLPPPPLGDATPPRPDVILLALAVGLRHLPESRVSLRGRAFNHLALLLADLAADASAATPAEWVVRHGLAGPAAPYLTDELAAALRRASPLTGVLDAPPDGDADEALGVADRVWAAPNGAGLLARTLAAPGPPTAVRRWRARVLDTWRHDRRDFVLDVYEAALGGHRDALLAEAETARAVLLAAGPVPPSEERRADALAVAEWWGPLALLARSYPDDVRGRRTFGYDYLTGTRLFRLARRLTVGAE
jgi:hypothetical protein